MTPTACDNLPEDERGDNDLRRRDEQQQQQLAAIDVIVLDSDDYDDDVVDDPSSLGYELLPQEPPTVEQEPDALCPTFSAPEDNVHFHPASTSFHDADISATFNDIAMDQERIDKIKSAMAGFALPTSSFPAWATVIPEEQWKERLMNLQKASSADKKTVIAKEKIEEKK